MGGKKFLTKYKGIYTTKSRSSYYFYICCKGKNHYRGMYSTLEGAKKDKDFLAWSREQHQAQLNYKHNLKLGIVVSECDANLLYKYSFFLDSKGYATTSKGFNKKQKALHKIIMCKPNCVVDHIDRNPLNNGRGNLRYCNTKQNVQNTSFFKNNTSGHKGVYFHKGSKKWVAFVGDRNKVITIGSFKNKEDAIKARKEKSNKLFGVYNGQETKTI